MTGGLITETVVFEDRIRLIARDVAGQYNAIDLKKTFEARSISEGDECWWDADSLYWTPKEKYFKDKPVELYQYGAEL